jgi:hypothetical protein
MDGMARGLERDPQVESILENRKRELGISIGSSSGISMSLLDEIGRGRQRGCNDPAESAQVMRLIHMPAPAFSCQAPDVVSDCCKS